MTTPYEYLSALLGDDDERKVNVGTIGGGGQGWDRFATISRRSDAELPGAITVSIYGVMVAIAHPDGARIALRTAGHYTPSTRAALALALGHPYGGNGAVSMRTPGSKGGKPGPWRAIVRYGGETYEVGDEWTTIPTYAEVPA